MADISKWDPFSGLNSLHSQLDDMFNSVLGWPLPVINQNTPAIDIYNEDDKNLVAEVQTPGFDKNDIEVNVHEGVLEIKGERHEKDEDKGKKRDYMMRESHTSFYRRFALPKNADGSKVKASFDNGVLKVTIPYKKLPAPKKVTIEAGRSK